VTDTWKQSCNEFGAYLPLDGFVFRPYSAYLGQIVSLPYILGALTAGRDIRWLIVAMCATTIRISVHSSTKLLEEEPVLVDEYLGSLAARESTSMGVDPVI
jgi:hypothetical protein